ncbi:MAG: RNA polymerase sigma factor [Verrucomicrobia bacterium]|nr:RNA polymerase sigma factor [Verrucomicrobiota bacterium]MBI3868416.1 RNA polymerase sigma factor [Verrucomicrobiota bacterium]
MTSGPSKSESIEELFAALESPLLSYAIRLIGDRGAAEDVVQEAFMKLLSQFAEVREPRRWLYRAVHNLALNQRRSDRRVSAMSSVNALEGSSASDAPHDTADPQPLPDEQIVRWEGIGLVRLTLETLDARSREIVRLKFVEELSYKAISEKTGLTVGHVGYLLHHALKAMGDELTKTGVIP